MQASQIKSIARQLAGGALLAAGMLAIATPGWATEQSQQRQQGRDVKQDTRQDSRKTKVDCKQESNKSNAECRQDKRDTKQEGRDQARDIKR
jgi:Flp pilus assembly protein TadB